jgi:dTDP-4-dehydrorhamnose 3,5-epimerase
MKFSATDLSEVMLIIPEAHLDQRGFFMETYAAREFERAGISASFVQDNHTQSAKGVLRGLHFQIRAPQGKLVRVVRGEIFDAAVDLRRRSPTFGRWVGEHLSSDNRHMLWIPPGFAHGFLALTEWAEVIYKVTDYYSPEWERTLKWDDPTVGVRWPLPQGESPILSSKDTRGRSLDELEVYDQEI